MFVVDGDSSTVCYIEAVDVGWDKRVGRYAYAYYNLVNFDFVDGAFDGHRATAPGCVGLAELHALHKHACDAASLVSFVSYRITKCEE